jgi:hypothetical protein
MRYDEAREVADLLKDDEGAAWAEYAADQEWRDVEYERELAEYERIERERDDDREWDAAAEEYYRDLEAQRLREEQIGSFLAGEDFDG